MKKTFIFLFLLIYNSLFSKDLKSYIFYIKNFSFEKAALVGKQNNDDLLTKYSELLFFYGEKEKSFFKIQGISTNLNEKEEIILRNLYDGKIEFLYNSNNLKSFKFYIKALTISEKINHIELTKLCLINILEIYRTEIFFGNNQYQIYLDKLNKLKSDYVDDYYVSYFNLVFYSKTIYDLNPKYFEFAESFKQIVRRNNFNNYFKTTYLIEKGLENRILKKIDTAISFYKKALNNLDDKPYYLSKKLSCNLNIASLYLNKNDLKKAKYYLLESKKFISKSKFNYDTFYFDRYYSEYLLKEKKYDSAYYYFKKSTDIEYDLNYKENAIEISSLNELYETEKKEKENLQLRADKEKNKTYLIVIIVLLIFISIIAYLTTKNAKKKRKLAEQQKELEQQKNLTLIKEQEIKTINAMVDGQEKERKRIAEDLHDNLGSVLATLKLHFENLKINREKKKINQEELFNKTENLIDEAYLKVRKIAHAKNAGVIANEGLLVAVKLMAEKISSADKIKINVVDFGLNTRLENNLELTIFRIIQELITNIIKHAQAKNATINLSLFDKNLNIIIEDDGKGFNKKHIRPQEGMGLGSIKTRIKYLNGNISIDSTIGKGSTIILDIPIE